MNDLRTEISLSAPNAALKTLFFRIDMTFRDVFSAKSISMYRCNLAACGPFYLPQKKKTQNKTQKPLSSLPEKKSGKKTHSEAPEPCIATCPKAYDLYFMPASETKPIIEKKIDCPCAEVGAYIDQRWTRLL
jgi:predicted small lipoprotein YifL